IGMSGFFALFGGSSFVFIDPFRPTPAAPRVAFSANAIGVIRASQVAAAPGARLGVLRGGTRAAPPHAAFAPVPFALTAVGIDSLAVLITLLFLSFAFLGLVIPSTMVLALEDHGPIAGMASALGGTLQMVMGGVMIVIVSLFFDGTALPMVTTIALCAVGALALTIVPSRRRVAAPQAAE